MNVNGKKSIEEGSGSGGQNIEIFTKLSDLDTVRRRQFPGPAGGSAAVRETCVAVIIRICYSVLVRRVYLCKV